MAETRTQALRHALIATPLGDDVLLFRSMNGTEQISQLFHLEVEMLSEQPSKVKIDKILGANVTIRLITPHAEPRFWNGIVARFGQGRGPGRLGRYRATIVPWLWLLTRTANCRIFENKTVPDIIQEIFRTHQLTDFRVQLSETYRKWEYCVQYRETDFNFVSRLMEQEGIYYFFEHFNGRHRLVLADSSSAHSPDKQAPSLIYRDTGAPSWEREFVYDWAVDYEVQPGKYILNEFDFAKPADKLETNSQIKAANPNGTFEIYDYPGEYVTADEGNRYAKVRIQELHSSREVGRGATNSRSVACGNSIKIEDLPPCELKDKELLVVAAAYQISGDDYDSNSGGDDADVTFNCSFTARRLDQPFRPPRVTPKPVIQGPQTAIVSGKPKEEIDVDEHGRVLVKFHWDREGKADENKHSCRIRVAQVWAGKKWGAMYIPRVGQEVIVEFLEGDPDHPIITGRVYNGEAKPPYDLPAEKTKSTIKSDTTPGGSGFNEIRFEDAKGKEQVFIHSQRRMDVRVRGGLYETNYGNREIRVGWEKGEEAGGDWNLLVKNDDNTHIKNYRYDFVEKDINVITDGNYYIGVAKSFAVHAENLVQFNSEGFVVEAVSGISHKSKKVLVEGSDGVHIRGGAINIEGSKSISLSVGGNFVVIDSAGVAINGTMVKINSGGSSTAAEAAKAAQDLSITEPNDAAAADDGKPGKKTSGKTGSRERKTRTYGRKEAPPWTPPPTPGVVVPVNPNTPGGGAGQTQDEIELVEVVEVVRTAAGDVNRPVVERKQFVNMDAAADHPEFGRVIRLRARVRFKTGDTTRPAPGHKVRFFAKPNGGNKAVAQLHATLRAGFDAPDGALNKTETTGADGFTPIVSFHTSRYGGDRFELRATLLSADNGGLPAGDYETWRLVTFEADAMKRPSGMDYMDIAGGVIAKFVSAHANAFTSAVEVGRNSSPAHQRLLRFAELNTFHTSCADAAGQRHIHLMYVDTVLTGEITENNMSFTGVSVPAGATPVTLALDATQATFLPNTANFVVSASWVDPADNSTGPIPPGKFTAPVAVGDYARHRNQGGDFDRWEFNVDLRGTGAPAGKAVTINLRFRSQKFLSGVQIGQTTTVAMRFRELRANGNAAFDLANATLQTSIHESSHAFGLASAQRPDGSVNADFITQGGGHCKHTTTCVMTPALHEHTDFCDFCSDNLRARNLARINVEPGAAMA